MVNAGKCVNLYFVFIFICWKLIKSVILSPSLSAIAAAYKFVCQTSFPVIEPKGSLTEKKKKKKKRHIKINKIAGIWWLVGHKIPDNISVI